MVFIIVNEHLESCYSNEDGEKIYNLIYKELKDGRKITISFEGVNSVTSSFVNTSFIELLNDFTFEYIKNSIEFKKTSKPLRDIITKRFAFEVKKEKELVAN